MPYRYEIRTKEGKLIVSNMYPIPLLKDAVFLGRLTLKDERIPKRSKLKVFKINEVSGDK